MARIYFAVLSLVSGITLSGCASSPPVDASSGSFGKASTATQLPPQGKPPAPGTDMSSHAKQNGAAR